MAESSPHTSISAHRQIDPESITGFVYAAAAIGRAVIGYKDIVFVQDEEISFVGRNCEISRHGVGVPYARVYSEDDLRVALFKRSAPLDSQLAGLFTRAKRRLSAQYIDSKGRARTQDDDGADVELPLHDNPLHKRLDQAGYKYDFPDPNILPVVLSGIQAFVERGQRPGGTEYMLTFDAAEPATEVLIDQAKIIEDAAGRLGIGKDFIYPSSIHSLGVPFSWIPDAVNSSERSRFLRRIQKECLPVETELGRIRWDNPS